MAFQNNLAIIAVLSIILGAMAQPSATSNDEVDPSAFLKTFEQWMAQFGRTYDDIAEKQSRLAIFVKNLLFVNDFDNQGNKTYKLNINLFSDMTNEEFLGLYTGFQAPNDTLSSSSLLRQRNTKSFRYQDLSEADVPARVDWREQGAVTPVKEQGQCSKRTTVLVWAFSTVATIEGITKIKSDKLISLSEQQLVDCNRDQINRGCRGGDMEDAFKYIEENGGITTEENYQYKGTDETCDTTKTNEYAAKITGYEMVPPNSENDLLKAVAMQPVSVGIDANGEEFRAYASGVFSGNCGTNLNHAVTIVGYGTTEEGTDYWLVKNSWGETWGEKGYVRILRNAGPPEGLCGIAMYASYPTASAMAPSPSVL
ncbi:PREDICTED: zingipain-2-like [Fragaria vesca subsp. vesca]|uniref:zingipain-2-like n=1 Tax=Fragaria vesca subsp. vesca TaxID=101020 RepID=UPI0002C31A43|nr:PREDICTED: zingipain-2-like [Fragaria vesca subsp. vesca]